MEGESAANFTPAAAAVGGFEMRGASAPMAEYSSFATVQPMSSITTGYVPYESSAQPVLQFTNPYPTEAVAQAPTTTLIQQAREQAPPATTTVIEQAREQAPATTTVIEQAREQATEKPGATTPPVDAGAWNTPGVKADLPAETNKDRATLGPDDKQVIHVLKGDQANNWPDGQTPDVVIGKDGPHVRPGLETSGKSYKDLFVKIEDGADKDTIQSIFLKDLNKITNEKATLDPEGAKVVPKEVADEFQKHDAPPPEPAQAGAGKGGGDGKPAPPPVAPEKTTPEEEERIKKLEEEERKKEQANAPGQPTDNFKGVTNQFDAKGGLADSRSVAIGWCPPELQGEYASLLAGMHNPPTEEELAKLAEWKNKHQSEINKHMEKNAGAMEAMGDTEGAKHLRELKDNLANPDWMAKQGEKDSFFGQSADAINGRPTATPDLGLGADTRAAIGHSHVVDEVASEYHKANPTDKESSIAQMFGKLSVDAKEGEAMVIDLQKINLPTDQSPKPSASTNPQAPDLSRLLSGLSG